MLKHNIPGKNKAIGVIAVLMILSALVFVVSAGHSTALAQGPSGSGTPAGPGGPPPDGGAGGSTTNPVLTSTCGSTTLDGEAAGTLDDQSYTTTEGDVSDLCVINGGSVTLVDPVIVKSGDTSSADQSSFYGLNAAVLVGSGSTLTISGGTITTDGSGTNGVFSTGEDTSVILSDLTINASGDGAHAVMATLGGTMTLTDMDMKTTDTHSGAIATDRGSGTITVSGGTVTTSGQDSPGIYSTGAITVTGATITASGAEAAVIEGANTITLIDTDLSSTYPDKWGVMLYQSMSGDAEGTEGTFTMTGGSLTYSSATGPLFFNTNSTAIITLSGVDVTGGSGILVQAGATDRWGTSGANGGSVIFTADAQTLAGDLVADDLSSISLTLHNGSTLTGAINADSTAKAANLALDASSSWTLTADSHLTCLAAAEGSVEDLLAAIHSSGYSITYDAAACPALGGQSYPLDGGGMLSPAA